MRITSDGTIGIGSTESNTHIYSEYDFGEVDASKIGMHVRPIVSERDGATGTNIVGVQANPYIGGTGRTAVNNQNWTATVGVRAFESLPVFESGSSGTITGVVGYMVRNADIKSSSSVAITNQYGIYIENLTSATNDYAIWTQGATPSYFGGPVGLGSTTDSAVLNLGGTFQGASFTSAVRITTALTDPDANNTNAAGVYIATNFTEVANRSTPLRASLRVVAPTVTSASGASVTDSATVYISGPPSGGATPTNGHYSLFVDDGESRFDGNVSIGDGTEGAPSLTNIGDTDTGIYFPAANEIALTVGVSRRAHYTAGGAWDMRQASRIQIGNGSAASPAYSFDDSNTGMYRASADTLGFSLGGTEQIRWQNGAFAFQIATTISTTSGDLILNPAGNVGIGTTAPSNQLELAQVDGYDGLRLSAWSATNSNMSKIHFLKSGSATIGTLVATADDEGLGFIDWNTVNNAGTPAAVQSAYIAVYQDAGTSARPASRMQFATSDGTNINTNLIIDKDGNVGIGDSAPTEAKLHVVNGAIGVNGFRLTNGGGMSTNTADWDAAYIEHSLSMGESTANTFQALNIVTKPNTSSGYDFTGAIGIRGIRYKMDWTSTSGGNITGASAIHLDGPSNSSSGTLTNYYTIYAGASTIATNNYGLYIEGASMKNVLEGKVGVGTNSIPAGGMLRVQGQAPTATGHYPSHVYIDGHVTNILANSSLSVMYMDGVNYSSDTGRTPVNLDTLFIANAPTAGTNVTATNVWALRINAGNSYFGGNVTIANGNGIDFSATSDASGMTSELLDDYEEGTWTATSLLGANDNGTSTGTYTKIGRLVSIYVTAAWDSALTGTGNVSISGIPFTTATFSPVVFSFNDRIYEPNLTSGIDSGKINFYIKPTSTSGTLANATESIFSAGGGKFMYIHAQYFV